MKRIFAGLAVAALSLSMMSVASHAAPPAKAKAHAYGKTKTAMTKCPMCGMALSSKPMKGAMAMKVNGKTYYCQTCGMHKMHKGTASKMHQHAQGAKHAAVPICPMCHVKGKMVKANGKTKYVCPECKMTL